MAGDPYHCECLKTARLTAERLGLEDGRWGVSFQSRFGRAEWLKPYTDEVLKKWAFDGIKSVDVLCPGFAVDCLETLEEVAMENRDLFIGAGGDRYRYVPALNDTPRHIDALVDLVLQQTAGWPETSIKSQQEPPNSERQRTRERALAMGAAR
jgi:ferrochelatase